MADPTRNAEVVLLVGGDPARRLRLADWFDADGKRTVTVTDEQEALACASEPHVGLLVVDHEQAGIEFVQQLRIRHLGRELPVLFLAEKASQADLDAQVEAFGLGSVDVCRRDAPATELLHRTGRLLELSHRQRRPVTGENESTGIAYPDTGSAGVELHSFDELAPLGSWHLDLTSGRLQWSETMRGMFGVGANDPVDLAVFRSRVHPDDRARVESAWQRALESGTSFALDHRVVADSGVRWIRTQGQFDRDTEGRPICATGAAYDISERKRSEQQFAAERTRLQDAFEAAEASTWEWHIASDTLHLDRHVEELGITTRLDDGLTMAAVLDLMHPDDVEETRESMLALLTGKHDRYHTEFRLGRAQGGWVWLRALGRIVHRELDGSPEVIRGIMLDITGLRAQQEQMRFAQTHDGLTGLPNRQRFTDTLRELLAAEPEASLLVVSVDLDDFEAVNHAHGRAAGNQVLAELATRLLAVVDRRDHLARTGGDEFSLVLRVAEEELSARAEELHELLTTPVRLPAGQTTLTASLGTTTSPQPESTPDADQLLRQADQAVYQAKLSGKNRTHRFDLAHHEHTRLRYALLDELADAIPDGQLIVHYQPQVDLRSGRVLGAEALVRWQHPTRGLLAPRDFIPVTHDHPIAVELGTHVIDVALTQLEAWQAHGLTDLTISVNTDPLQLADPEFFARTLDQLQEHRSLERNQLTLEILETGALEDLDAAAALIDRSQAAGITIALDDFGTGFASLTVLKRLGARLVKIDSSFTQGLMDDPEDAMIVHAITTLTQNLGRTAFAEGVETIAQGRRLLQLGCQRAQGYLIARPMPGDEFPAWVSNWQPPSVWATTEPLAPDELPALLVELQASALASEQDAGSSEGALLGPPGDLVR